MNDIIIVRDKVPLSKVKELAKKTYTTMIKGAVDIEREVLALGGEWHIDANNTLVADGSKQKNLWGFNIVFSNPPEKWLEYHSLINIRPAQGNKSMEIENEKVRKRIADIVSTRVETNL